MANRTPPSQFGNLFNFAGGGLVHVELFALLLVTAENPTLFEAIARYLLPSGDIAERPAAADAPLNSFYISNDEGVVYQNQDGTWVAIAATGGGPPSSNSSCGVSNSTATAISHSTLTILSWDTNDWNPDSLHSTTTNPSRITVDTDGIWLLNAGIEFGNTGLTGLSRLFLAFKKNGTTYLPAIALRSQADAETQMTNTAVVQLANGDYIEVAVLQESGSTVNVTALAELSPYFSAHLLRAL